MNETDEMICNYGIHEMSLGKLQDTFQEDDSQEINHYGRLLSFNPLLKKSIFDEIRDTDSILKIYDKNTDHLIWRY
jgi:hypothetical protein